LWQNEIKFFGWLGAMPARYSAAGMVSDHLFILIIFATRVMQFETDRVDLYGQ
jgi:hypothetical protein